MAEITLGADPEFGLIDPRGRLVNPGSVIRHTNGDRFGIDGCGRVAELRPDPAKTPKELVENIRHILQTGVNENPHTALHIWKAGSTAAEEPIGGHIHIGNNSLCDMREAERVAKVLTKIVTPLALMAEDRDEAIDRRVGTSYGAVDGENLWREQPWGMEFRTLCSWLMGPREAESILTLTYIVGAQFDDKEWMNLAMALPMPESEHFIDCNKKVMSIYLTNIARVLKKAPVFKEFRSGLDFLFDTICSGKSFDHQQDMKKSWGLTYEVPAAVAAR